MATLQQLIASLSVIFLASATTLLSSQAHGQGAGGDLCGGAIFADLCRSVVGGAKDPSAALDVTLARLISETNEAKSAADKLPPKESSTCREVYGDALDSLKESQESLKSHDLHSFNIQVSAVMSDTETCGESYAGKPFPIAKQNELIDHLASVTLYLSTLIK